MTNQEFSSQFDILYDNVTSGKAPGLNDYEKSVFLTKGQEQILKNYFNPLGNKYQEGHGDSSKRTMDFSNVTVSSPPITGSKVFSTFRNTLGFEKPSNILLPLTYLLRDDKGNELQVIPVKESELFRVFSKPYKEPYKGQAYKIDTSIAGKEYEIIVGKNNINKDFKLYLRYIKIPQPIILRDLKEFELDLGLPENILSINGERNISECELSEGLHNDILDRAVTLAKMYYEGNLEGIMQIGTINE